MLCDPTINLDTLKVGYIEGIYNETTNSTELEQTKFGKRVQEVRIHKYISYGKLHGQSIPFNETVTLREIYENEGNVTVTRLLVQFPYDDKIVQYGVPTTINKIALHKFTKWNFSPTFLATLFDRVPSHPLYEKIKKERKKWLQRTGDVEAFKRLRSTWLVNKPNELLPYKVYEMWYGNGALIIPETLGAFKGRELGDDFKP